MCRPRAAHVPQACWIAKHSAPQNGKQTMMLSGTSPRTSSKPSMPPPITHLDGISQLQRRIGRMSTRQVDVKPCGGFGFEPRTLPNRAHQ
eukprot:5237664-Prymnesium_polylepis.1